MKKGVLLFFLISFIPSTCLAMDEPEILIDVEAEGVSRPRAMNALEDPIDVEAEDVPAPPRKRKRSDDLHPAFDQYAKTRNWRQHTYVMPHYGDLSELLQDEKDPNATQSSLDTRGETFCLVDTSDRTNIYQINIENWSDTPIKKLKKSKSFCLGIEDIPEITGVLTRDGYLEKLAVAVDDNIQQRTVPQTDEVFKKPTAVHRPQKKTASLKKPLLKRTTPRNTSIAPAFHGNGR